jgi:hypothetical protein
MNFMQFSLKRTVEESDAGIAPQCLWDATGSGICAQIACGVSHALPGVA